MPGLNAGAGQLSEAGELQRDEQGIFCFVLFFDLSFLFSGLSPIDLYHPILWLFTLKNLN